MSSYNQNKELIRALYFIIENVIQISIYNIYIQNVAQNKNVKLIINIGMNAAIAMMLTIKRANYEAFSDLV